MKLGMELKSKRLEFLSTRKSPLKYSQGLDETLQKNRRLTP